MGDTEKVGLTVKDGVSVYVYTGVLDGVAVGVFVQVPFLGVVV